MERVQKSTTAFREGDVASHRTEPHTVDVKNGPLNSHGFSNLPRLQYFHGPGLFLFSSASIVFSFLRETSCENEDSANSSIDSFFI